MRQGQSTDTNRLEPGRVKPLYHLTKHTYFCLVDGEMVFLDLCRDRYSCLTKEHSAILSSFLDGTSSMGILAPDAARVAEILMQVGLLVDNPDCGRIAKPTSISTPILSLMPEFTDKACAIGPRDVWRFSLATASASRSLRRRTIASTVRSVASRRQTRESHDIDRRKLAELFGVFQALRPYYPRPYLCRFDSLALLNFLAFYGIFPQWVYGVRLKPFAAHCWVQAGAVVVNDYVETVRTYVPIMSV